MVLIHSKKNEKKKHWRVLDKTLSRTEKLEPGLTYSILCITFSFKHNIGQSKKVRMIHLVPTWLIYKSAGNIVLQKSTETQDCATRSSHHCIVIIFMSLYRIN